MGNSCGDINLQFAEVDNDCTYMQCTVHLDCCGLYGGTENKLFALNVCSDYESVNYNKEAEFACTPLQQC